MHFINQNANRFRICMLIDAVTEVKDVAAIANLAEAVDHATCFATDGSFIGKKNGWIEVALKSHRILPTGTGFGEIHCPDRYSQRPLQPFP